jgi:hypothetical protein
MALLRKAACWLGVFGLMSLASQSALAWGDQQCSQCPHPHFGARFIAFVHIQQEKAHAQWYTYFPTNGAGMMDAPSGSVYPTWPSVFPPPQSGPWPYMAPGASDGAGFYHPVGNFNTSAPSY